MNLVKNALILSLLLGKVVFAAPEPQELLNSFRKMAQKERLNKINQLEEEYKKIEAKDIEFSDEIWGMKSPYIEDKKQMLATIKDWNKHVRLDHIKILYYGPQGTARTIYIQLEDSKFHFVIGAGFMYSLFFKPRVYRYDEQEVEKVLKQLTDDLPSDKQPNVIVYKSRKFRDEKGLIFTSAVSDLYSVCIDYSDGTIPRSLAHLLQLSKQRDAQIDWSKKNRS